MNNIEHDYLRLLKDILDNGVQKEDRTGTGTISVFGRQIRHKMSEGFPLLTTKKMPFKTITTELLWFLRGDTNIKFLVDNNCHIWDGDAYKSYEKWYEHMSKTTPFEVPKKFTQDELVKAISLDEMHAKTFGDLGPIYGKQWRSWGKKNVINYDLENVKSSDKVKVMDLIRDGGDYSKYDVKVTYQNNSIDQISNLIKNIKADPDSRRLMVSAWNPDDLSEMVLPPCHYGFQVYTRKTTREEKITNPGKYRAISLMWNQRSADTFLGLPFNIASYGLLLTILAKEVNMIPDELIGNLGDVHLYSNHIEQAKEQITREPMKLPELWCLDEYHYLTDEELVDPIPFNEKIEQFRPYFFTMHNYEPHPHIKAPLSN
jgi:thymidylate synthase